MVHGARLLGVALLMAGCSTAATTPYDVVALSYPTATIEGRVVASRVVAIAGDATGTGPVAGGAAGGILGPLGFLAGAGLGYLVEQRLHSGAGIEYVIELADGRLVTVVQARAGAAQPLPDGTPVRVEQGALSSRVVAHPDAARVGGTAGGWINPDRLPPDAMAAPPLASTDPRQRQPP